jgi:hypothetical protein
MKLWDEMRQVLSLFACYDPPPGVRGGPAMQDVINAVLDDSVPGLRRAEVLLMAQDLGAKTLMRHILEYMWKQGNGKRPLQLAGHGV